MKYVLVALVVIIAYGIWRNNRKRTVPTAPPKAAIQAAEEMVVCAHCGIHLPHGDAIRASDSSYYCCTEHKRLDAR